ncbi:MAG: LPS-assembly protein LptD, partial [Treponema sp.]|nr:LPS-assembly protein LptD [Treponema sp.]
MNSGFRNLPALPLMFLLAAVFLFAAPGGFLSAQEEEPEPPPETEVIMLSPEQNRINMDIRTSSLSELAAWCRSIGLSEGGTSGDLARRLRDYFKITEEGAPAGEENRKIITIESARSTDYFRIETVNEDYARLSGEVKISLKDGDAVHEIRAWDILFNKSRNIITASGGVVYTKTEGDKIETFRGDSITVDLDNWSSIFLGGVSERSLQSDETTYLFEGTVISRDEEEVIVLNKATISNANNPESLWSLNATRVWLLPGSDFAIYNAVLKVGEIPVMYIPFFYYPADEVIFHPVIGFRTREGNYVQTTTYILGRPKSNTSTQSSLTKILGSSSDMEKTREGLFLRSTGKKSTDPNTTSLVAMVDYYANLGAYLGTELTLPQKGMFGSTSLSLGIGLSRTIALQNGSYTPYFPDYNGETDWNTSNLFSMEVPFRYRFRGSSSLNGKYGSLNWNVPFNSDPMIESDFTTYRAEDMDWVNMIQKGAAIEEEDTSQNLVTAYSWNFSGNVTPTFPKMDPYINNISINTITSTVSFKSVDRRNSYGQNDIKYYSPSSFFYAPDTASLYSLNGSVTGTPFSIGQTAAVQPGTAAEGQEIEDPLKDIGVPRSPFESKAEEENTESRDPSDKLVPPVLTQRFDLPRSGSNKFSVDYSLSPASASTLKFDSNKWKENSDINWGDVSSIVSYFTGSARVNLNFSHYDNMYSGTFSYTGDGSWRQYSYLNEEAEDFLTASGSGETDPDKVAAAKQQEYRQSYFSTSYNLTTSLRPLYRSSVFSSSSLQYSLSGLAVKSNFIGTGDEPDWELIYGEWNKDKISTHQFQSTLSASVMDKAQTFSLIADLPPKDSALSWSAGIRVWVTETTGNMKILYPGEEDNRKLEPFYANEKITFGTFGNFSQSLTLDTEKREVTSLSSALNLTKWGLSASYNASRMLGYEYDPDGSPPRGWVQRTGEPELRSRDFSISYTKNFSKQQLWDNRMNFTVNTSSRLNLDLQRYTESKFTFSLGFTIGIAKFLDLAMSANSDNARIYQYMKDLPLFNDADITLPQGTETNIFRDLFNSFRFD